MFIVNREDSPAPEEHRWSYPVRNRERAIELARNSFAPYTSPGEITVSDEMHNIVFRIYRRNEGEAPVELLA